MSVPIVQRHPSLRWLVPVGVIGAAIVAATGMLSAGASIERLPATTPAALVADLQQPTATGFSGTLVSRVSLGLPQLPSFGQSSDAAPLSSLLGGTHTLQVWYGGPDKQRVALLGATDETDVFRDGRDLWHWNSADRVAVHTVLPAADSDPSAVATAGASIVSPGDTPQAVARRLLAGMDPSTLVTVRHNRVVADRSAYELVLTPRDTSLSRIGSVHVEIDGRSKLPLGVQVYARDADEPAIDLSYSSVRLAQPSDTYFRFSPPAGATVHTQQAGAGVSRLLARIADPLTTQPGGAGHGTAPSTTRSERRLTVTGTGWSSVVEVRTGRSMSPSGPFQRALTPVSGAWGKGWVLDSALVSVLVVRDGRVYAGAVDPSVLYAAAASK